MQGYGQHIGLKLLALLILGTSGTWFPAFVGAQTASSEREHMTREMLDDAQLNDVFFLDADRGWAVGDRGVILHTEDGGRHWQLQRVDTNGRFHSIHFVDEQHGWAAGGRVHAYTHRTSCIVARTHDGGRNWRVISGLTLPALKHVQFQNTRQGWAIGNGSALYPAGVFRTDNGGLSWATLPAGMTGKWLAADFRDAEHGVVAGYEGNLAVVSAPHVAPSRTPQLGQRPIRAMHLPAGHRGWMVGDGGLVMHTSDGGISWQNPDGPLPPGVTDLFDFRAVAVLGEQIWIAGSPGSIILHSPDGGRTWALLPTDQRLPLHAITFVDPQRGWAVGDLGTVLATRDGGRTWRRQRTGGTRVALLGIFGEPERIPMELFALQSGDEGYLGYAEVLNRRDVEVPSSVDASLEDRASAALSAVGACGAQSAWRFPLRQRGLQLSSRDILDIWDRANDGQGAAKIEELVVRRIRQWRPEVVITEAASPNGEHPLAHLVNQVVLSAVTNAAEATSFPDHAMVAGLEPWRVKKVYCVAQDASQSTVRLTTAQLATRLGRSLAEHAEAGYALVSSEHMASPVTMGFRLLQDQLPQAAGRTDIFSGIFLQPGGEARRRSSQIAGRDLESLTRAAQKRRNVEQIFEMSAGPGANQGVWLGQVQDLTKTLSPTSAGQVLFQLSQRYRKAGQLELAAQSLELLVEKYPHHSLCETALVWLVQYYASGEIAWQLRSGTHFDTQVAAASVMHAGVAEGVRQADYQLGVDDSPPDRMPHLPGGLPGEFPLPPQVNAKEFDTQVGVVTSRMRFAGRSTTAGAQHDVSQRATMAVKFAKMIQLGRPELFAEPWVQFPTAVAFRAKAMGRDAESFYHRLGSSPIPSDWERCAQAELWLSHGRGSAPKPLYVCHRGVERPHLDGHLNDAIWQKAERLQLTSAQHDDGHWPAAAMLAWDDQFLYFAASCRKSPGCEYPETPGPRPRDPGLQSQDRVELLIDLDRDYTSFYRLTVDHRGWTGEACLGDIHWNPTWYVANHATPDDWTIEIAIPLNELTPAVPAKDGVWAFGMQRIVPGVGIQSYTKPAAVEPRGESFALLMFQ